jgi:hypothetical protein
VGAAVDALMMDFLAWLAPTPKPYREVMDAWRTSCPRLTVWEDAVEAGFVERVQRDGRPFVALTQAGARFLKNQMR